MSNKCGGEKSTLQLLHAAGVTEVMPPLSCGGSDELTDRLTGTEEEEEERVQSVLQLFRSSRVKSTYFLTTARWTGDSSCSIKLHLHRLTVIARVILTVRRSVNVTV